jgi:predicted anti-sigma-YlaC factor YlaD
MDAMDAMDCGSIREWLELEADGRLGGEERHALDRHATGCTACREERRALAALHRALERSRVGVRGGFTAEVMRRLPAAGWEASAPRAWRLPLALLAAFAAAAAALVGVSSARFHPGVPFAGAVTAIADMMQTAALAGAGLLAASWRGIGLAVGELLATSPGAIVAFVILVLAVDLLALALIRRRRAAPVREEGSDSSGRSSV